MLDRINKKDSLKKQPGPGLEITANKISHRIEQIEITSTAENPNRARNIEIIDKTIKEST